VDFDEDEIKGLSNVDQWIQANNSNPKKKEIIIPEWWNDGYTLKVLYTAQFKKKKYLKV
jgi:hypothetical protein